GSFCGSRQLAGQAILRSHAVLELSAFRRGDRGVVVEADPIDGDGKSLAGHVANKPGEFASAERLQELVRGAQPWGEVAGLLVAVGKADRTVRQRVEHILGRD